jgi:hypothetical protein
MSGGARGGGGDKKAGNTDSVHGEKVVYTRIGLGLLDIVRKDPPPPPREEGNSSNRKRGREDSPANRGGAGEPGRGRDDDRNRGIYMEGRVYPFQQQGWQGQICLHRLSGSSSAAGGAPPAASAAEAATTNRVVRPLAHPSSRSAGSPTGCPRI